MSNINRRSTSAQGADLNTTAQTFFSNGYANPTAFLDSHSLLSENGKRKYAKFWDGLKANLNINNTLTVLTTDDGIAYTWVEMEWPRANRLFRITLFTPQMFDLLVRYQEVGAATIKCSLQELIDEATKLENEVAQS